MRRDSRLSGHNLTSCLVLRATSVAKLCEAFPDEGAEIAARIRDLMFDRKKLMDQPL